MSVMETLINASRDELVHLELTIKWNRFILRFLGIWPSSNNHGWSFHAYFFIAIFFLLYLTVPQTVYLIMVWGQLDLMIEVLTKAIALNITVLLKLINFRHHSKVLGSLLSHVVEDWMTPKSKPEWDVMIRSAKVARMLSIGATSLTFGALVIYTINHILTNMSTSVSNATVSTRHLLFYSYWPFDTDHSPNYELTCALQFVAITYTALAYAGIDTFLAILILHVCGQCINLQITLKKIISNRIYRKEIGIRKELATFVDRHQRLNRFAESIEESFNILLLIHTIFCTLQFCILGYNIICDINNSENGRLSFHQFAYFVNYGISNLLQLFIYCYVGEKLNVESTKLSYVVYQCEWYQLHVREVRDLMFVMVRAISPLKVTAGKFCSFSLSFFFDILKASMGYLSVLLSVQN